MVTQSLVAPRRRSVAATAVLAGGGSFVAIFLLSVCDQLLDATGTDKGALIGSFGATAVLVYGAPAAEYSRFRNVVGGHVLSALIGVTVASTVTRNSAMAAAFAVGAAVAVMMLTRTTHPPGGATALIAVIGGERIEHMGFWYVAVPVLAGALAMYTLGVVLRALWAVCRRLVQRLPVAGFRVGVGRELFAEVSGEIVNPASEARGKR